VPEPHQAADLHPEAVQVGQPGGGQLADQGLDLAGGLAAAHRAEADHRLGGQFHAGGLVPPDAVQILQPAEPLNGGRPEYAGNLPWAGDLAGQCSVGRLFMARRRSASVGRLYERVVSRRA
jgi:hypothetical protein